MPKLLPPIGGLGVRGILDHANGAFTASWHEAQVITGEKWRKPADKDCSGVYNSQHAASATTDAAIMAKFKATANPRDAQRLNRLDSPHANAWLVSHVALPLPVSSANPC